MSDDKLKAFVDLGQRMQADVDAILASGERIKLLPIDAQATRPPPAPRLVDVHLQLSEPQAYALAELCKRIGWRDVRTLSVGDAEARNMISAIEAVRVGLAHAGVVVR